MDQPGKVANPARGQLNTENVFFPSAFAPENLVSRGGFGSPVPRQPAHLHTQAESGAYGIPPEFRGGVVWSSIIVCARNLCTCVCVFIKLHTTAQSGLVILVILCHSH